MACWNAHWIEKMRPADSHKIWWGVIHGSLSIWPSQCGTKVACFVQLDITHSMLSDMLAACNFYKIKWLIVWLFEMKSICIILILLGFIEHALWLQCRQYHLEIKIEETLINISKPNEILFGPFFSLYLIQITDGKQKSQYVTYEHGLNGF